MINQFEKKKSKIHFSKNENNKNDFILVCPESLWKALHILYIYFIYLCVLDSIQQYNSTLKYL
jgi:hypothetical protein